MAITLTPSAARQILSSVEKFGGLGLRLGVKAVGCSGFAYTFDMAKEVGPDDQVFEGHSAKLVVDARRLPTSTAPSSTSCAKASSSCSR